MPLTHRLNMFANNPLDRAGHLRTDDEWLASQIAAPDALFVPLWRGDALVLPEAAAEQGRDVAWLPKAAISAYRTPSVELKVLTSPASVHKSTALVWLTP